MATTKSRPFTIRSRNQLLDDCAKYKINKTQICNDALKKQIEKAKKKEEKTK